MAPKAIGAGSSPPVGYQAEERKRKADPSYPCGQEGRFPLLLEQSKN